MNDSAGACGPALGSSREAVDAAADRSGVALARRSRNGTAADGESLAPGTGRAVQYVIRIGDSPIVPMPDIGPLQRIGVRVAVGRVEGPALQGPSGDESSQAWNLRDSEGPNRRHGG